MSSIHPDIERWVAHRQSERAAATGLDIDDLDIKLGRLDVPTKDLSDLVIVSAKLASGFFRPTKRTEVVWVDGDSELAVGVAAVGVETTDGLVRVKIPVRCDETGPAAVEVVFAVGSPGRPAGVYASTYRRPVGPALIVDVWGEALVAFAWQTVLGLVEPTRGRGREGRTWESTRAGARGRQQGRVVGGTDASTSFLRVDGSAGGDDVSISADDLGIIGDLATAAGFLDASGDPDPGWSAHRTRPWRTSSRTRHNARR